MPEPQHLQNTNKGRRLLVLSLALSLSGCVLIMPALAQASPVQSPSAHGVPQVIVQAQEALTLLSKDKEDEAASMLHGAVKAAKRKGETDVSSLYVLALIDYSNYRAASALKYLKQIESYYEHASVSGGDKILLNKRMAQCYYRGRKYSDAASRYKAALEQIGGTQEETAGRIEVLEGLLGSLYKQRKVDEAERYCSMLVEDARKRAMIGNPIYASSYLWSLLRLIEIYDTRGKTSEAETARRDASLLVEGLIDLYKAADARGIIPSLRETFLQDYVSDLKPASTTDYLWIAVNFEPKSLPLIGWSQGPSKAAVICIHGLGLENRAFTFFGREMARRGYAIYSMDVRGFGAWKAVDGYEDTAFEATLEDIKRVVRFIRRRSPDLPIFVLGESMGGAIALRAAAVHGDLVSGVIASVPSARRYQNEAMGFKVALGILAGGFDKPVNVGGQVTTQATSREDLLQLWRSDPKGKMSLTPKELIRFDRFMRHTVRHCKSITKTPVLIVQGLADRLVKPQGTFDMFKVIPNQDRTLVVVGDAEHLIFESDKQDKVLIESVSAWLEKHIKPASKEPAGSAVIPRGPSVDSLPRDKLRESRDLKPQRAEIPR